MSMAIESKVIILQLSIEELGKRVNSVAARLEVIEQKLAQLDAAQRPTQREILHRKAG